MEYKNGVYFSWFFQHYTITQIFLPFGGKIKEPSSQNLHSENSWKDTKMRFIFHGFFSTKRWRKYFFNLPARSKRRQLIIEISWDFSKIQKWSLFFLIFSALYDDTNIFSIWRQDQSTAISKFKFWKILNRPYNGVYFSWFFSTMQTQFFSVSTAGSKCRRHKIWFRKI